MLTLRARFQPCSFFFGGGGGGGGFARLQMILMFCIVLENISTGWESRKAEPRHHKLKLWDPHRWLVNRPLKHWAAVKELKLSYHIGESLLFTIYTQYGNLI